MYTKKNYAVMPRTIGGFFEDALNNGWNRVNEEISAIGTPVNIFESAAGYELQLVAPGLKKEDFKISLDKNILNLSYDHKDEQPDGEQEKKWLRKEYKLRSFKRSFTLNEKIDAAKISAAYTDGILKVTMLKKEMTEMASHEIAVS